MRPNQAGRPGPTIRLFRVSGFEHLQGHKIEVLSVAIVLRPWESLRAPLVRRSARLGDA
jgi:hypothetical protein